MLKPLYRGLTQLGGPLIRYYLGRRRRAGKEDVARQGERLGVPSLPRPPGPLVWFHAASVGESLSTLVLINRLIAADAGLNVLVTTGTVTSAQLMAARLPARAFHQYVPVDRPGYVARFLDSWRPDLALWVESELWPNLVWETRRRGIPAALVNARISERSFRRWRWLPNFIGSLLAGFSLCLAQTEADAGRLRRLGAVEVRTIGNLKFSAEPLPAEPAPLAALTEAVAGRPLWLMASSHQGEDVIAATVHATLAAALPGLLTVIAPRHPQRGPAIEALLAERGLRVARRASGALPAAGDAIYLADTLGELGLLYRLTPVVCIGGSFVAHGGHNPIEPAQLGCAVLFGPDMSNFTEIAEALIAGGAALELAGTEALAATVGRLLADPEAHRPLVEAANRITASHRQVASRALAELAPLLLAAGITPPAADPA